MDAAWIQKRKLEERLGSLGVGGPIDEANRLLDVANMNWANARNNSPKTQKKLFDWLGAQLKLQRKHYR